MSEEMTQAETLEAAGTELRRIFQNSTVGIVLRVGEDYVFHFGGPPIEVLGMLRMLDQQILASLSIKVDTEGAADDAGIA